MMACSWTGLNFSSDLKFYFVFSYFLFVYLFSNRRNLILKFSSLQNDKYRGNPTCIKHVAIISLQVKILGRINTVVCWYTPFFSSLVVTCALGCVFSSGHAYTTPRDQNLKFLGEHGMLNTFPIIFISVCFLFFKT